MQRFYVLSGDEKTKMVEDKDGAWVSAHEAEALLESLLDCFAQACGSYDREGEKFTFDHMCLSSYEHAQDLLIKFGAIEKRQCRRV